MEDRIEIKSLCMVQGKDYKGQRWLFRLADVENGKLKSYTTLEHLPKLFDNRERIFWKNGPEDVGAIGIWNWSCIPNRNDSMKDYVESNYAYDEFPIEICEIKTAYNIDNLVEQLKRGVSMIRSCRHTLFCCSLIGESHIGVLCKENDLICEDNRVMLKSDLVLLPQYEFSNKDIFRVQSLLFYSSLDLGTPKSKIVIQNTSEIVKGIILKRASWNNMKLHGVKRGEWKQFKEFLSDISDRTLYQEVAACCEEDEEQAKLYVENFIANADRLIDRDDIESEILLEIINNNSELKSSCEMVVEEKWADEHKEKVAAFQCELDELDAELALKNNEKKKVCEEIKAAEAELERILEDIESQERFGEEVAEKVRCKIENAQRDAAEFISSMSFIPYNNAPIRVTDIDKINDDESSCAFTEGLVYSEDEHNTWEDTLTSIEMELGEAGIASEYLMSFSAFLFSAYVNNTALILAGPNGESIANALSTAISGKTAGILDCSYKYSKAAVAKMLESDDKVIIIKNPFSIEWMNKIIELLLPQKKFYILINAFVEDLIIEPKGLFNYAMPVMTEPIVDSVATNKFVGGKPSKDYRKYKNVECKQAYRSVLNKMQAGRLTLTRMQRVISDMRNLNSNIGIMEDIMYVLLPYAYVTGNKNPLIERVKETTKLDNTKKEYILTYLGEKYE